MLLVGPYPGRRWLSIARYCEAIEARSGVQGVFITRAKAPWWNPPSVARGVAARWWRDVQFQADRAFPADLVHFADQGLAHHVGRFRDRPTVVTCHDLMPFRLPGFYRTRPERLVKQAFLRRSVFAMRSATHVIAVSAWTAAEVTQMLDIAPARISVVPNMLAGVFRPYPDARPWLQERGIDLPAGPLILSVGHAGEYKNIPLVLAALSNPGLRWASLVRVGAPLAREQRQFAARLGVLERVIELGGVASSRLARLYASCTVLAQPSLGEGFGVPVIEAMGCGLPVVASDGGALPEVVADAGAVVPLPPGGGARDEDAVRSFARALAAVIDDPSHAAELRSRGIARAELFRPAAVTPRLFAAYRSALDSR